MLQRFWGLTTAKLILLCGKVPLAVAASTGLLVSAGFVFNEVFVYWFPNFAFAYLLLGVVVGVNLLGQRAVAVGQIGAVAGIAMGILALSVSALWASNTMIQNPALTINGSPTYLVSGVVAVIGFDLAIYGLLGSIPPKRIPWPTILWAILFGGSLLAFWGWIGLSRVPQAKLANTTIAHMVIARALLGQTGRIIMGGIVIAGVFAAVNGLMYGVSRIPAQLVKPENKPTATEDSEKSIRRGTISTLIILSLATALAMAGGWAGEPVLETFIRVGVIFWLIHYGVVNLTVWRLTRLEAASLNKHDGKAAGLMPWLALIGLALAIGGMAAMEPEPRTMAFLLVAIPLVMGISLMIMGWIVKYSPNRWNRRRVLFSKNKQERRDDNV